jgi:hypothetical protein
VARRGHQEKNNDQQQHKHRQEFFSGDTFEELGFSIMRRTSVGSNKDRQFTSYFGLKPVDWETGEERTQHAQPHKRRTRIRNGTLISRRLNRPARNC